jgi:lipid-A-disaccharide synthase
MRDMISLKVDGPAFISLGEPSGDLYASYLVRDIRAANPGLKVFAIGGENMAASGADILLDYNRMMTFGFAGGVLSSLRNYSIYKKIARLIYKTRPKTFIGVAYPGLNILLCKYAKYLGCRVYYFLPPQIWAWGTFRKYFIKQWVDKVISVFPFEYEFYKKMGIDAIYLENPLFEGLKNYKRNDFEKRIGLMPGSRKNEIKRNLPVITELMKRIDQKRDDIEFVLILHSSLVGIGCSHPLLTSLKALFEDKAIIISENRYQTMKDCDLLIICSGTASLEAAAMKIPQVFFNRPAFLDYYITKRFLKIKEYNLTNLYYSRKIVLSIVLRNADYILQRLFSVISDCIS